MFALFTQQPSVNRYTEQEIRVWCDCVCVCVCARGACEEGVLAEGFIPAPEEHVRRSADPSDVPWVWSAC